jgi:putative Holliday junction resolvase
VTRWLGIDHGTKRIGLAVGDTVLKLASPLTVLDAGSQAVTLDRIAEIAAEHGAEGVVVGLPINMDDTEGPQAAKTRAFARRLADRLAVGVVLWDERLSSFQADQALAGEWTRAKRRARQDAVAAAVILQEFLTADGQGALELDDDAESGRPET